MSLTIELPPDVEDRLRQEAERQGMEAEPYAARILADRFSAQQGYSSLWCTLSHEEWIRQTREWSESHRHLPPLPPEAMERASFYEDDDGLPRGH